MLGPPPAAPGPARIRPRPQRRRSARPERRRALPAVAGSPSSHPSSSSRQQAALTPRPLTHVCVYAGSSSGRDPAFEDAAADLGRILAGSGITLVYGGGAVGLMGVVADATLDAGGTVIGVIPKGLFRREIGHPRLTQLIEVTSMHERKQKMFELADGFVALPGGLGTVEELTEMTTWAQLGIHGKPIVTLDAAGYWQPFHLLLRAAVDAGFMSRDNLRLVVNVERVAEILPTLRAYDVPYTDKWLELDQT